MAQAPENPTEEQQESEMMQPLDFNSLPSADPAREQRQVVSRLHPEFKIPYQETILDMDNCLMIPTSLMERDMFALDPESGMPYEVKGTVAKLAIMSAIVNSSVEPKSDEWLDRTSVRTDVASKAMGAVASMAVVASDREERVGRKGLQSNTLFSRQPVPKTWEEVDARYDQALDNGVTLVDNKGNVITYEKPTVQPDGREPMMIAGVFMANPDNTGFELAAFDVPNIAKIQDRTKKAFAVLEVNPMGGVLYGANLIFGDAPGQQPKSDCIIIHTTEQLPPLDLLDNPQKIPGIRGTVRKMMSQPQIAANSRRPARPWGQNDVS